jgi:hypothetical protein
MEWEPPVVLHEFSYSSDEEILPNPTPLFMRNSMYPKGYQGALANGRKEAISSASCLPLMSKGDQTPEDKILLRTGDYSRPYASISSRLPADQHQVKQIAERGGAITWLRKVALGTTIFSHDSSRDEHTSDEESGTESSSSSQKVVGISGYQELAASEPSDDEDMVSAMNLASVQVHSGQDDLSVAARASNEHQHGLP